MRFWCLTPFKFWVGDKLVAEYVPGQSYTLRAHSGHTTLRTMLFGGQLQGKFPVTITVSGEETEYQPGDTVPGWITDVGLVTPVAPPDSDVEHAKARVVGRAEVRPRNH